MDQKILDNIRDVGQQDYLPWEMVQYLRDLTCRPSVIYDIGSSVLHWHRHARTRWPQSQIICFDANPAVGAWYRENGADQYHLGLLSDRDGELVDFWYDPLNLGGNSIYRETTDHYAHTRPIKMSTSRLDTVVRRNRWPLPDLIKMDVQGAELDVLRGAPECLGNARDVLLECQHQEYNQGAPQLDQVRHYLEAQGFEMVCCIHRTKVDGDYHFRRAVFDDLDL